MENGTVDLALCSMKSPPSRHPTVDTHRYCPDRHLAFCLCRGLFRQMEQPAAAGDFHNHHREGVDLRLVDERAQLFDIDLLAVIEFRTGDGERLAL